MVWWGHPITVGMPDSEFLSIDYFLSLDVELHNAGLEQYSEQMVRMEYMNTAPFIKVLYPNVLIYSLFLYDLYSAATWRRL